MKQASKVETAKVAKIGGFDPDVERTRYSVDVKEADEGAGFLAIVRYKGEKFAWVYRSDDTQGKSGIFPNEASARRHGTRWIEARLVQLFRTEQLRLERSAMLPERLAELMYERDEKKAIAKNANTRVKEIEKLNASLIHEAMNPQVEIAFAPSSEDFTIFDGPAVSDGTNLDDSRQTDLPIDDGAEREPRELRRPGMNPNDVQWPDDPEAAE